MDVDSPEPPSPSTSIPSSSSNVQPLLCPPKPLVQCVFPDTFVFPVSLWSGIQNANKRAWTVAEVFQILCTAGPGLKPLYDVQKRTWTPASCAPNFLLENHTNTESDFAKFLNTIVLHTVTVIGANPGNVRTWSAEQLKKMAGASSVRKPDVVACAPDTAVEWRSLDFIVEMKNGKEEDRREKERAKDRQSWCELAERANFLFSFQHDRR